MITLRMACGCQVIVTETEASPLCAQHQERRVTAVKARAPKFRGVCIGPHATYEPLNGVPVSVGVKTDA